MDVNKGDDRNSGHRSRLVVREVKRSQLDDVFAATPPLAAKKVLFSLAVSGRAGSRGARKLGFVDVKKAYLHSSFPLSSCCLTLKCHPPVVISLVFDFTGRP